MDNPKILPWIARKAGLPEARVVALWRAAMANARRAGLKYGTQAFWKQAMDCLLQAVEAEKLAEQPALGESAAGAMLRCQLRMGVLGLVTAQSISQVWTTAWQESLARKAA